MSIFEKVLNVYIWIRVFLSPALLGFAAGYTTGYYIGGTLGNIAWAVITGLGMVLGIRFAESRRKKDGAAFHTGTINYDNYINKDNQEEP